MNQLCWGSELAPWARFERAFRLAPFSCLTDKRHSPPWQPRNNMVVWVGNDPTTSCLRGRHSSQLSYQTELGRGGENRILVSRLKAARAAHLHHTSVKLGADNGNRNRVAWVRTTSPATSGYRQNSGAPDGIRTRMELIDNQVHPHLPPAQTLVSANAICPHYRPLGPNLSTVRPFEGGRGTRVISEALAAVLRSADKLGADGADRTRDFSFRRRIL